MTLQVNQQTGQIVNQELDSKKDLIKKMYCANCTDDEMQIFIHACKRTGLDPFMKQIYAIKRGAMMTIQTGIDGFRLIAERTGNYSPGKEPTFNHDDKGCLISSVAFVKKRTSDGTWHEVAASAYLDEYNPNQGLWKKMPRAMLSKCAEALALRKAFPAELSGLYTSDEMQQAEVKIEEPMELSDAQRSELAALVAQIEDEDYIKNLADYLRVTDIRNVSPKEYDKTYRSLRRKLNGGSNDASRVA